MRSASGSPFNFAVDVFRGPAPLTYTLRVQGPSPRGNTITQEYEIAQHEHLDFLGLLTNLARDFGMRVPLNRIPKPNQAFRTDYHALVTRPLTKQNLYGYGDPAALRVHGSRLGSSEDWYYIYSTSNDAPDSFPIIRSNDLRTWSAAGFIFPEGRQPSWAAIGEHLSDYWAPEVHLVNDEFCAYFVARHKTTSELCIGVAKANHPEGPFVPHPEPLLTGDRIDPHIFVDRKGTAYLYWKEDRNGLWPLQLNELLAEFPSYIRTLFDTSEEDLRTASFIAAIWPWVSILQPMERFFVQHSFIQSITSRFSRFESDLKQQALRESNLRLRRRLELIAADMKTPVFVRQISRDGLSLTGRAVKVLENDQDWEAHVIEGMWVAEHADRLYMFYAGNDFSTVEYGIGVATADSPQGPFRKMRRHAYLKSSAEWVAPGHPSVAIGPHGNPILFLHAYFPEHVGYKQFRVLLSGDLNFDALDAHWNPLGQ